MHDTLALFHTAESNRELFGALAAELAPDVPVTHIVDEGALREVCARGAVTPALRRRVCDTLLGALDAGARAVVCTCSSLGAITAVAAQLAERPVLRIDRPLAEAAVAHGAHIVVAATLPTTLAPTRELIREVAAAANKAITLTDVLCADAWERFQAGDREGYLDAIADELRRSATHGDVLVLAQASMARAIERCPEVRLPVLTSPRSGLAAAIAAYRRTPPVAR